MPNEHLKRETYSPDIEEFSESEDIFHMSQEGENIININNDIAVWLRKKPKYRPIKKIAKPNGLFEKLRAMNNKRVADATNYVLSNRNHEDYRKIQIVQFSNFRRRVIMKFTFADELQVPDLEAEEQLHFMTVPLEFHSLLNKHSFYDVVFDLQKLEFLPNKFMYFCKMIRASRSTSERLALLCNNEALDNELLNNSVMTQH